MKGPVDVLSLTGTGCRVARYLGLSDIAAAQSVNILLQRASGRGFGEEELEGLERGES